MPLNREGTFIADEVSALTAFLRFKNGVIAEDEALNARSLPKVKMPMRDAPAPLPESIHGTSRLKGYTLLDVRRGSGDQPFITPP
jgi:hypothetical protein